MEELRIAVAHSAYYAAQMCEAVPQAAVERITSERDCFEAPPGRFDAMLHAAEVASTWILLNLGFSMTLPKPETIKPPPGLPTSAPSPGADPARQPLHRIEAKGRDPRRALPLLHPGDRCGGARATLVGDPRRSALG